VNVVKLEMLLLCEAGVAGAKTVSSGTWHQVRR